MTYPDLTVSPDPTLAIEAALSEDVRDQIKARFPNLRGADVADLLDMADDCDYGLEHLEPALDSWGHEIFSTITLAHPAVPTRTVTRLVSLSMLAFVLAGDLPLAEDRVRDLASDAAMYALGQVA